MRDPGSASDEGRPSLERRSHSTDPSIGPATAVQPHPRDPAWIDAAVRAELDAHRGRSPDETICPLLRVEGAAGHLLAPVESPYGGNRCTALADPWPAGELQQELVCLSGSFATCPRYRAAASSVAKRLDPGRRRRLAAPTRAAGVLLGVLATSVAGFALANADTRHPSTPSVYAALERCVDAHCYVWTVEAGQTLPGIAARLGQPIERVLALNPGLVNPGSIRVGDRIRVPPPGV